MIKRFNKKIAVIALFTAAFICFSAFFFSVFGLGKGSFVAEASSVRLDMDGTEAWLEFGGAKVDKIHPDNAVSGVFSGATGETKMSFYEIGHEETLTVKTNKTFKANELSELRVRICISSWLSGNTVTISAYSLADAAYSVSAGEVKVGLGNVDAILSLKPSVLADSNGEISGFVIRKSEVIDGKENVFFDYVEASYIEIAEEPTSDVELDIDGENAWLEVGGIKITKIHPDNAIDGLFAGATGKTKMSFTEDLGDGEYFVIRFAKRYKAEYFDGAVVKLCVGNNFDIIDGANTITTTAYASDDTNFAKPAGEIEVRNIGNVERTMQIDTKILADSDGYISGMIIRKTETDNALKGQYFVDYVRLVLAGTEEPDPDKPDPDNPDPDNPDKPDPDQPDPDNPDKPDPDEPKPYDPPIAEDPTENVILDLDGENAWLEVGGIKVDKIHPDNAIDGLFAGATGKTKMSFTENLGEGESVTVRFAKKYKAELLGKIRITLAIGNNFSIEGGSNTITTTGYNLNDTEFLNPAGSVQVANLGNVSAKLVMDASVLADEEGYVSGFVMRKTETDTSLVGQYFADDVTLGLKDEKDPIADKPEESVLLDMNGSDAWVEVNGEAINDFANDDYDQVKFLGDGSTKITYTQDLGEGDTLIVKFSKRYKAEYFELIKLRIAVGNWAQTGNVITTKAYALHDTDCENSAGQIKTAYGNVVKTMNIDPSVLADEEGYINGFILKKTQTDKNAAGQYFFDYAELCLVGSLPPTVIAGEYTEKDISDIMPVGAGKEFELKATDSGYEKTFVAAGVKTETAADKINFKLTPSYNGKFSVYILLKAPDGKSVYEDGGLFFWLTSDSISVGASSDGTLTIEQVFVSDLSVNPFESGKQTIVSVAVLPYFIDGIQEGYYLALYINNEEEPIVSAFIENSLITLGSYTNICLQDLGNDQTEFFAPAAENFKSAEEVMNVTLATKSGKTDFTTARAALKLDYLTVEGSVIEDVTVTGEATFDKVTKYLTFGKNGSVTLKYKVSNVFGEFESNELTITYSGGKTEESGCKGAFESTAFACAAAMVAAAALVAIKKRKG